MKKIYIVFVFILVVFSGCEQNITLNLPKYEDKVAVYCLLSPSEHSMMYLNLSKSYYEYGDTVGGARFIKTAKVVVTNTNDNIKDTFKLDSAIQNGELAYFYIGKYDVIAGKHYVADIRYNGKVINAETTVPLPVEIDHFDYTKVIDTSFGGNNSRFDFNIYLQDRKGEDDNYKLANNDFSNFISDEGLDGHMLDLPYSAQIPPNFTGTYSQQINLVTTTRATAKYLQDLQNQASSASDPFSVPVILQSNINGGLGIFGSYSLSNNYLLTAH